MKIPGITVIGKILALLGIILGVIGFLWEPIWMGTIACVFGLIGVITSMKSISIVAMIVGAIAIVIGLV